MGAGDASELSSGESEDEFASVNSILLTGSLLALIVIGYRINTHRLKHVPESGAAMALGFAVGLAVRLRGITEEEQLLDFRGSFFFFVLLPPIIFEAGLSLETQMFVDNLGAIFAFAVIGTIISTWVTSKGLRWFAELGLIGLDGNAPRLAIHCHLFGALISATDPVATIALFGGVRFRADPLLHSLINGESVLNDAVAIALFSTISQHLDEEEPQLISWSVLGHFFFISTFSLALGLLAGAFCSWCFCRSRALVRFPDYEIGAMCLSAYLTFAVSQLLGLSGIVSLFFFGVVLAQYNWYNLSEPSKVASKVTFTTLAKLAESCVFVYLGVVAALSLGKFHWHLGLVFYTCLVITIARAAHIFPLTWMLNFSRHRKINPNMTVVMWISGLRGAIAFALSLRLPCSAGTDVRHGAPECRNHDLLVTTTISIVLLTTLVVGGAMEHVMMRFRVIEPVLHGGDEQLTRSDSTSLSVPLASRGSGNSHGESFQAAAGTSAGAGGSEVSPNGSSWEAAGGAGLYGPGGAGSLGGSARSLWRFNARGRLYQAFARFDLNVLQPALGGPCRNRGAGAGFEEGQGNGEAVELPSLQGFIAPASLHRPEDDQPPAWSRAVVFE